MTNVVVKRGRFGSRWLWARDTATAEDGDDDVIDRLLEECKKELLDNERIRKLFVGYEDEGTHNRKSNRISISVQVSEHPLPKKIRE